MAIELRVPGVDELRKVVDVLGEWQSDAAAFQLHPGDLGWFWRAGAEALSAALRIWVSDGRILAVGLLDGPDLLRMTVAPDARQDDEVGGRLVDDLTEPARGVLGAGKAYVEAPTGSLVRDRLFACGWRSGERWTPLRRDLTAPVETPGLRVEVVGPALVPVRTALQRAAFDNSTFTDERWHVMAAAAPYADARCLVGFNEDGIAVAAVTVWSAGSGRPGLLEPMGVHRAHRGHGYGRAICLKAAAALQEMGSSSAMVATPSGNVGGVATYESAGFERMTERRDVCRGA